MAKKNIYEVFASDKDISEEDSMYSGASSSVTRKIYASSPKEAGEMYLKSPTGKRVNSYVKISDDTTDWVYNDRFKKRTLRKSEWWI